MIQSGHIFLQATNAVARISPRGRESFSVQHEGETYHAELVGDELVWDDGDVWCRDTDEDDQDARPQGRGAAGAEGARGPGEGASDGSDEGMCAVCMEKESDSAVIPCGHICGCFECLQMVRASARPECPMCRHPLDSVLRVYRC